MSPEYAVDEILSIKYDVFSFGFVLLEIIGGKSDTRFYQSHKPFILLGYVSEFLTFISIDLFGILYMLFFI